MASIGPARAAVKALLHQHIREAKSTKDDERARQLRVSLACLEIANSLYRKGYQ